jgi:hypothetical protein
MFIKVVPEIEKMHTEKGGRGITASILGQEYLTVGLDHRFFDLRIKQPL